MLKLFINSILMAFALVALVLIPFAALAQTAADPAAQPDLSAIIQMAFNVISQWKVGGVMVGLVALTNIAVNLLKIQWVKDHLTVKPWLMPILSCVFAGLLAMFTALATHASWYAALAAGLIAGLSAIGFHEFINSFSANKQAERAVGAVIMDAIKVGDGAAHAAVSNLHAQLDGIDKLAGSDKAAAVSDWANAHPPGAPMGPSTIVPNK